jgi:hypothetical protein
MKFARTFPGKLVYFLPVVDPEGTDRCAVPDPGAVRGAEVVDDDLLVRPHIAAVRKEYNANPSPGLNRISIFNTTMLWPPCGMGLPFTSRTLGPMASCRYPRTVVPPPT